MRKRELGIAEDTTELAPPALSSPQPAASETQAVPTFRSPQWRIAYANAFRFKLTPSDFVLTCVAEVDVPGGSAPAMQEEASIVMTLQSLKVLSLHLANIVQAAEAELGPIRIPTGAQPTPEHARIMLAPVRAVRLTE